MKGTLQISGASNLLSSSTSIDKFFSSSHLPFLNLHNLKLNFKYACHPYKIIKIESRSYAHNKHRIVSKIRKQIKKIYKINIFLLLEQFRVIKISPKIKTHPKSNIRKGIQLKKIFLYTKTGIKVRNCYIHQ